MHTKGFDADPKVGVSVPELAVLADPARRSVILGLGLVHGPNCLIGPQKNRVNITYEKRKREGQQGYHRNKKNRVTLDAA